MHAVARLTLQRALPNIQASWVKMGPERAAALMHAGCNDMGEDLPLSSDSIMALGSVAPSIETKLNALRLLFNFECYIHVPPVGCSAWGQG